MKLACRNTGATGRNPRLSDPRKACAEINSLDSRTGFLSDKASGLAVTLAFTTTEKGKLCASLIEKELKARKVAMNRLPVRERMRRHAISRRSLPRASARTLLRTFASASSSTSPGYREEPRHWRSN